MAGRIWFPGNPWPEGHAVEDFAWAGRLDPDGRLWFELGLSTEDYDAQPPTDPGEGDWRSPTVWNNYHRCTIEAGWKRGLLAAEPGRPFRLTAPQTLTADPLPIDFADDPAFTVYLLGHDAVADHEVVFTPAGEGHDLVWTGAIALYYAGEEEFRYRFRAELSGVSLLGIRVGSGIDPETAQRWLGELVDVPERFALDPAGRWFAPVPPPRRRGLRALLRR